MEARRIVIAFGTRREALKMCLPVKERRGRAAFKASVRITGQRHRTSRGGRRGPRGWWARTRRRFIIILNDFYAIRKHPGGYHRL